MGLFSREAGNQKAREAQQALNEFKNTAIANADNVRALVPGLAALRQAVIDDPDSDASDNAAIWAEIDSVATTLNARIATWSTAEQVIAKRIVSALVFPSAP